MGKADGGVQVAHGFGVKLRQRLQGFFLAPHLVIHHDLAFFIAPKDGLNLQEGAGQPRAAGDAPTLVQIFQIIYHKKLLHAGAAAAGIGLQLRKRLALPRQLGRFQHHQALAQRSAPSVNHGYTPPAVLLRKLLALQRNAPAAAADAAGNAQIQHVLPLLQTLLYGASRPLGVHHGGLHLRAMAHGVVEGGAAELDVVIRLHAVHLIGQGHRADVIFPQYFHGQIGCRIRKDLYHIFILSFAGVKHSGQAVTPPCPATSRPACRTAFHSPPWSGGCRRQR